MFRKQSFRKFLDKFKMRYNSWKQAAMFKYAFYKESFYKQQSSNVSVL